MSQHDIPARYPSRRLSTILLAVLMAGLFAAFATTATAAPAGAWSAASPEQEPPAAAEGGDDHGGSWLPTIAKVFNFAVLVGLLVYFLRAPIAGYLRSRSDTIRKDLVDAATLRSQAERQLSDVRSQLAALPAELDQLRQRGEEELQNERARMKAATAKVREQLLERTRRDIDHQFRQARRKLVDHTAKLAVDLARRRIETTITSDDQSRLIERYAAEVQP